MTNHAVYPKLIILSYWNTPSGGSFCHYRRNFLLYFIGIHKFFRRFHLTLPSAYAIISNCAGFAREICYAMTGGEHLCPESWLPEKEWWG